MVIMLSHLTKLVINLRDCLKLAYSKLIGISSGYCLVFYLPDGTPNNQLFLDRTILLVVSFVIPLCFSAFPDR
jgi:hypothetical protein